MNRIAVRVAAPTLALLWMTLVPGMMQAGPDAHLQNGHVQNDLVRGDLVQNDLVRVRPVGIVRLAGAIVPTGSDWRRPLDAEVWTERGRDAVYQPGESVEIRFRTSDDAYVCIYDIDTEGRLRILFPAHPGDDGFVPGGRVMTLPSPQADYDFIASGPPGIELLEIVASRHPLRSPWSDHAGAHGATDDDHHAGAGYWEEDGTDRERWVESTDWEQWAEPDEWHELDEFDELDELDEYDEPDTFDADAGTGAYAGSGTYLHARWTVHGLLITGDPFVAIHRVNRRLLPREQVDGDYATDYVTFHIARRHRYPRYVCGDCHGRWHPHDPYRDACSIFTVRINTGWRYHGRHVRMQPRHHSGPRYVYVRHQRVAPRYRTLKRHWPSHERHELRHHFRAEQPRDARRGPKSTQVRPKSRRRKTTDGYDWKTLESRGRSMRGERSQGGSFRSRRSAETRTGPKKRRPDSMRQPSDSRRGSPGSGKQYSNPKKKSSGSKKKSSGSKMQSSGSKKKSSGSKMQSTGSKKKSSGAKSKSSSKSSKSKSKSSSKSSSSKSKSSSTW